MIEEALALLQRGWSIIPVGRDKKPLIQWTEYQKRLPTEAEVRKWFALFSDANIGVVTGGFSGLVIVDVEAGGNTEGLTPTLIVKTGGGGWHYYYKHPGFPVSNSARKVRDLMDIRGDGGYVVAPPSKHASGNEYEWSTGFEDLADLPDWLLKRLQEEKKLEGEKKKNNWQEFRQEIHPVGERNDSAAKYVGGLLTQYSSNLWESVVLEKFKQWNQEKNNPPLDENELRTVFESIAAAELAKRENNSLPASQKKNNQATELIHEIRQMGELFNNQYQEPFIHVEIAGHKEICPISSRSSRFRSLANIEHYKMFGNTLSDNKLKEVAGLLEAIALFEGKNYKLFNRMVRTEQDEVWLDMCDRDWRAIKINKDGWSIVDIPPILFRRMDHNKPYTEPIPGGDVKLLEKYLNLEKKEYSILIYAFLVASLMSNAPVPCLVVHGQQGSAKTTLLKLLRDLVDPSSNDVLDFSNNKVELIQMLNHNRVSFFDNLTHMTSGNSDLLCKAITGFSASKRRLYTDDEDILRSVQNVVGLNGIINVVTRPDLLERSLLLECTPIKKPNRKTDDDVWKEFRQDKPVIFGGLLDLMVKVLNKLPEIEKVNLNRMADYNLIGEAVAQCSGMKPNEFTAIYGCNIAEANRSGVEQEKLAEAIIAWMDERREKILDGTPTELYELLTPFAKEKRIVIDENIKTSGWPKDSARLSQKLTILTPLLSAYGIEVSKSRDQKNRNITITKTSDGDDSDDAEKREISKLVNF